jgi:hypothetical protein
VICLAACSGSFENKNLPTTEYGGIVAFVFWDDLTINIGSNQSVAYSVVGVAPNRTTTITFRVTDSIETIETYHFQVVFDEQRPGLITYTYFQVSDSGASATIGVQSMIMNGIITDNILIILDTPNGTALIYSFNQSLLLTPNITVVFNTNTGIFTS